MFRKAPSQTMAVAQAFFVTFLWSTSWVLIKIGLKDLPPLTFAGLRYMLAFLCLLPFTLRPAPRAAISRLKGRDWGRLVLLGVLIIAVTQSAQYVGLALLPAVTTSLMLNFTAPGVALMGLWLLGERPSRLQWLGMLVFLTGVGVYFYPVSIPAGQWLGLGVMALAVISYSLGAVLGRSVNRDESIPPLVVTAVSMGVGAALMLAGGLLNEPWSRLSWVDIAIITYLAVVNTAFAFTLWNHTLRTLPAMESSMINNTMLIQIAILAWIFLDERLSWQTGTGLALAALGVALVQWRRAETVRPAAEVHAGPAPDARA
jgi:drug/metabolite transporter (DMT)-like permease